MVRCFRYFLYIQKSVISVFPILTPFSHHKPFLKHGPTGFQSSLTLIFYCKIASAVYYIVYYINITVDCQVTVRMSQ